MKLRKMSKIKENNNNQHRGNIAKSFNCFLKVFKGSIEMKQKLFGSPRIFQIAVFEVFFVSLKKQTNKKTKKQKNKCDNN